MSRARCVSFLAQIGMPADDPVLVAGARRSCVASRRRTEAGSAAGAPTTSTAPGRCCARSTPRASPPDDPAVRRAVAWLLARAARGWRLGRGRRDLPRRAARPLQGKHAKPDRLGAAWPDGGGRGRPSGGGARHRLSDANAGRRWRVARGCRTTPSVSRACSTCAITATAGISRCWRWRATATCAAATRARVAFGF